MKRAPLRHTVTVLEPNISLNAPSSDTLSSTSRLFSVCIYYIYRRERERERERDVRGVREIERQVDVEKK